MDSRDNAISEIIRQVAVELVHPISPAGWGWADAIRIGRGGARTVPSDECFVWGGKLFLARRMEERLEPEEWRPILASSLILKWRLESGVKRKILLRLILPVIAVFITSTALLLAYGLGSSIQLSTRQQWIIGLNLAATVALVIVPSLLYGSYYREAKLLADSQAARLVGSRAFLDVLRKIDHMGLRDVERAKSEHRWSPRVGIERRISNLQGYSDQIG